MIAAKELEELIANAERHGAVVTVERDAAGGYRSVQVRGLSGCGPHPMGPLSAAERLRDLLGRVTFAEYVGDNWLNIVQIDGRWAILRDVDWTMRAMAEEGYPVRRTGESSLLPNDAIATFIEPDSAK